MSPKQHEQKMRARAEAEHHHKNAHVTGYRKLENELHEHEMHDKEEMKEMHKKMRE